MRVAAFGDGPSHLFWNGIDAALSLYRLDEDGESLVADLRGDILGRVMLRRGDQRGEGRAVFWVEGEAERAAAPAVKGAAAGDDLAAFAAEHRRELERPLDRLGAAVAEKYPAVAKLPAEDGSEFFARGGFVARAAAPYAARRLGQRLRQHRVCVAEQRRPVSVEKVDIAASVAAPDPGALAVRERDAASAVEPA